MRIRFGCGLDSRIYGIFHNMLPLFHTMIQLCQNWQNVIQASNKVDVILNWYEPKLHLSNKFQSKYLNTVCTLSPASTSGLLSVCVAALSSRWQSDSNWPPCWQLPKPSRSVTEGYIIITSRKTVLWDSKLALFKNYDCYDVTNHTLFLSYYVDTVQWKRAC